MDFEKACDEVLELPGERAKLMALLEEDIRQNTEGERDSLEKNEKQISEGETDLK